MSPARLADRWLRLLVGGTTALALPPAAVALGFWVAAAEGADRLAALMVAAALAVAVHLLVRRGAAGRLQPREVMALSSLSGGLLTSFAVALGLASRSLNTALYEVSRADVGLAALVVLGLACVALGHAAAAGRVAQRDRRASAAARPQPRFADDPRGISGSADLRS